MPNSFRRNLCCPAFESQLDGLGLQSLINPNAFDEGFCHIESDRPLKTVRQDSRLAHSTEMKGAQFTPNQVVTAQIPLALNTQQRKRLNPPQFAFPASCFLCGTELPISKLQLSPLTNGPCCLLEYFKIMFRQTQR